MRIVGKMQRPPSLAVHEALDQRASHTLKDVRRTGEALLLKEKVALHGGDVTIRSALGKGTTVSVSFPQARCMDAAAARPAFAV